MYNVDWIAIVHSMKVACQLTGISPQLLRAWERRYFAVRPARDEGNRRVYSSADISRLRLLRAAVDHGHPIRQVATLSNAELEGLLQFEGASESTETARGLVRRLLNAAECYRPDLCDEALGLTIAGFSPLEAVQLVIAPAMVEAGERWHASHLTAAQEHLLTASVERIVMTTMNTYQKVVRGPGMLFSTLSGERHVVGSLLAAFLAASRGIRCLYLGPDLSPDELAVAASRSEARVVVLSFALGSSNAEQQLRQLAKSLSEGIEIWVGGAGIQDLSQESLPANCCRFENFAIYLDCIQDMQTMTS